MKKTRWTAVTIALISLLVAGMMMTGCGKTANSAEAADGTQAAQLQQQTPKEPEEAEPEVPPVPVVPEEESWKTVLVNITHPLQEGYVPELRKVDGTSYRFDVRAADALERMLADCRAEGLDPMICSTYRTWEKQTELFEKQVKKQQGFGLPYDQAYEKAKTVVAFPGTSEHQTGLTTDICAKSHQILEDSQADQPAQQWLMANSWKYGFILRYPLGKSEYTKIIWEPWHYRYVGEEVAQYIFENDLCLEEYWMLIDDNIAEEYAPIKQAEEERAAAEAAQAEPVEETETAQN